MENCYRANSNTLWAWLSNLSKAMIIKLYNSYYIYVYYIYGYIYMQLLLIIVTLLSMIFLDLRLPQLKVCKTAVKFKQGKCEPSILALQSNPC